MFSFNFLPEEPEGSAEASNSEPASTGKTPLENDSTPGDVSHPFVWKENLESLLDDRAQQEIVFQEIELSKDAENDDNNNKNPLRRVCMDQYEKEVTPGIYEGGLQVWECSLDLVRYFQEHNLVLPKSALELGCGHALPGCWLLRRALQQQSATNKSFEMVFVDYNDYVIDDVTLSNIVLNTADIVDAKQLAQRQMVQLGAGDWKDMSRQFADRRFDWIIAAETTYTQEAAKDTVELLLSHLTVETGIGWVASKRYYFGVGGGTDALREAAQTLSQSGEQKLFLKVETVRVLDSGVGNIREILKVTCHAKEI